MAVEFSFSGDFGSDDILLFIITLIFMDSLVLHDILAGAETTEAEI